MGKFTGLLTAVVAICIAVYPASADLVTYSDGSGLSGTADFTRVNATHLRIVLTNTSTSIPAGASGSDRILTSLAFLLPPGIDIVGGASSTATITAGSASVNFSLGALGGGADVSREWGRGTGGGTGFTFGATALLDYISTNSAGIGAAGQFSGSNRDGPDGLDGPQAGLISAVGVAGLGGQGAVNNSVTFDLTLSGAGIPDLSFLASGSVIEFGSDYRFIPVPVPGAALLGVLGLGAIAGLRRRLG